MSALQAQGLKLKLSYPFFRASVETCPIVKGSLEQRPNTCNDQRIPYLAYRTTLQSNDHSAQTKLFYGNGSCVGHNYTIVAKLTLDIRS